MKFGDTKVYVGAQGILAMMAEDAGSMDEAAIPRTDAAGYWGIPPSDLLQIQGGWKKFHMHDGDSFFVDAASLGLEESEVDAIQKVGVYFLTQKYPSKQDKEYWDRFKIPHRALEPQHAQTYMVIAGTTDYCMRNTLCFWVLEPVEVVS